MMAHDQPVALILFYSWKLASQDSLVVPKLLHIPPPVVEFLF